MGSPEKRRRSQAKREKRRASQRAGRQTWREKGGISFSTSQVFLMLGASLSILAVFFALLLWSAQVEWTSRILWNKSFWCLFGGLGTLPYLALVAMAFRKSVPTPFGAAMLVFCGFLGVFPVFTGSQLAARLINRQPEIEERFYAPYRILSLHESVRRKYPRTGTENRLEVVVAGERRAYFIPRDMGRLLTEGGCVEIAVKKGRLGFDYVADIRLPRDLRSRVKCVVGEEPTR